MIRTVLHEREPERRLKELGIEAFCEGDPRSFLAKVSIEDLEAMALRDWVYRLHGV